MEDGNGKMESKALDSDVPSMSLWVGDFGGWVGWGVAQAGLRILWGSSLIAALEVPKLGCTVINIDLDVHQ